MILKTKKRHANMPKKKKNFKMLRDVDYTFLMYH